MRRRAVDVEVALLHVLAVVAFVAVEAEEPLLEDRVLVVPEHDGKTQAALAITDTEQAVLTPAVHSAARVVVREVGPHVGVRRIVLAHGPPLAFGEIRSPAFPILLAAGVCKEALTFGHAGGGWWVVG